MLDAIGDAVSSVGDAIGSAVDFVFDADDGLISGVFDGVSGALESGVDFLFGDNAWDDFFDLGDSGLSINPDLPLELQDAGEIDWDAVSQQLDQATAAQNMVQGVAEGGGALDGIVDFLGGEKAVKSALGNAAMMMYLNSQKEADRENRLDQIRENKKFHGHFYTSGR